MEEKKDIIQIDKNKVFIKNILKRYSEKEYLKIVAKNLHYIKDATIFQFYITLYKSSNINPFDSDILLIFEFYENIQPYVRILNDFITPSLNDGRNIFYCLTNKHQYIFNKDNLSEGEKIFDELIGGLNNFLLCLKENMKINTFIYYGEYEINRIYHINDFILNMSSTKYFRIIEVNEKNEEMKYIIITQLFILLFEPVKDDMSLCKLVKFYYLKDINFSFGILYNKMKKYYIFKISNNALNDIIFNIEFLFYDDSNDNIESIEDIKYSGFKNVLFAKKKEIDLDKYKIVITNYKPLFAIDINKINKCRNLEDTKMYNDYKLYISYFEELINYYKGSKDESINKRVKTFLEYLNYCCVDFITFNNSNYEEVKYYQSKIVQYINNKNNTNDK